MLLVVGSSKRRGYGKGGVSKELEEICRDRKSGASAIAMKTLSLALSMAESGSGAAPLTALDVCVRASEAHPFMGNLCSLAEALSGVRSSEDQIAVLRSLKREMVSAPLRSAMRLAAYVHNPVKVTTISNSQTVYLFLLQLKKADVLTETYSLYSYPGGEGASFARRLSRAGIQTRLVADSQMCFAVSRSDLVVSGCDMVIPSQGVINKAGSKPLALCAARRGVGFYVVAESLKKVSIEAGKHALAALHKLSPDEATFEHVDQDLITQIATG